MAFDITQLGQSLIDPFVVFWNSFMVNLPSIIAALVVLVLGYFVGVLMGLVTKKPTFLHSSISTPSS